MQNNRYFKLHKKVAVEHKRKTNSLFAEILSLKQTIYFANYEAKFELFSNTRTPNAIITIDNVFPLIND